MITRVKTDVHEATTPARKALVDVRVDVAAGPRPAFRLGRNLFRLWRHGALRKLEPELVDAGFVLDHHHAHVSARLELAEEHFVGKRFLDGFLNLTRHRARSHQFIIAINLQPLAGLFTELDGNIAVPELRLQLQHEFLDHLRYDLGREMTTGDA